MRVGPLRSGGSLAGPDPITLALATTLPATLVTATSANLNGAVNPEGLTGTWWFAYGTTPAYGVTTAPQPVSGTLPITVSTNIAGLTAGAAYHFAVVVQTAGGTVMGIDQTFVAQVSLAVATTSVPMTPGVSVPHFSWPFTMTTRGAQVVEQDSLAEIFSCVQAIAHTPLGAIPEVPGFGMPQLAFGQAPLDTLPAVSALELQEPRASQEAVASAVDQAGSVWRLSLTTQTAGASEN